MNTLFHRCATLVSLTLLALGAVASTAPAAHAAGSPDLIWMRPGVTSTGDLAISPDGKMLALVTGGNASPNIKLIRRIDGIFVHMIRLSYPALAVTFSPDSRFVAVRCHVADFQTNTPSYYIYRVADGALYRAFPAQDGESPNPMRDNRIAFSSDGKQLVTDEWLFGQDFLATHIYNIDNGLLQAPVITGYAPGSLAANIDGNIVNGSLSILSPDGGLRFSFMSDGTDAFWNPVSGAYLGSDPFKVSRAPTSNPVYIGPQQIALSTTEGLVALSLAPVSPGSPPNIPEAVDPGMAATSLWVSPEPERNVLAALGPVVTSANPTRNVLRIYRKHPGYNVPLWNDFDYSLGAGLTGIALPPNAKTMFVAGMTTGGVPFFNQVGTPVSVINSDGSNSGVSLQDMAAHIAAATSVAYSPDGKYLFTGGRDGKLMKWSVADGARISSINDVYTNFSGPIEGLTVSPNGKFVAYAVPASIVLLDLDTGVFTGLPVSQPERLLFSPDGSKLAAVTEEPQVRVWSTERLATGGALKELAVGGYGNVQNIAFSPDSSTIAVKSQTHLYFWQLGGPYPNPIELGANSTNGFGMAYSPDGARLAVGGNQDIYLLDTSAQTIVKTLHDPVTYGTAYVNSLAYRPDGALLLSAHTDGALRTWNVASGAGTLLQTYTEDTGPRVGFGLIGVAAAPNGCDFACVWDDGSVSLANMPGVTPLKITLNAAATAASATYNSVKFYWATNLPADSRVDIGIDAPNEAGSTPDSTRVTTHQQTINGLLPATTFYYRVRSMDARGVTRFSETEKFTTRAAPTPTAVVYQVPFGYGGAATVVGVILTAPADSEDLEVAMSSSDTKMIPAGTKLKIPAGSSGAWLRIVPPVVSAATPVTVSASLNGVTKSAALTIKPPTLAGFTTGSVAVVGGQPLAVRATLQGVAPPGGLIVPVASNSPTVVGGAITIPAGTNSGTATLATKLVGSSTPVTLTASLNGVSLTAAVNVQVTFQSIAFSAAGGYGGVGTGLGVALSVPAGPNGVVVSLSSTDTAMIPAGTTLTIPAGAYNAWIHVTPSPVAAKTVISATATLGTVSKSATFTVSEPVLTGFIASASVLGGQPLAARVTIASPAPAGGAKIAVTSSSPAIVGGFITVPAGATMATVSLVTIPVSAPASATLTAAWESVSRTANIGVQPSFQSILFSGATGPGGVSTGLGVVLYAPAGPGGVKVTLSSTDTKMIPAGTTLTIPAGAYNAWIRVTPAVVSADKVITVTGALGSFTKSASYTVKK